MQSREWTVEGASGQIVQGSFEWMLPPEGTTTWTLVTTSSTSTRFAVVESTGFQVPGWPADTNNSLFVQFLGCANPFTRRRMGVQCLLLFLLAGLGR